MQTQITSDKGSLTIERRITPRATITEERIQFLRKMMPRETGLAQAAQRWRGAIDERDIFHAAQQIRRYIPQALNLLWIAQDAQKSRAARKAFNTIRLATV